MLAACSPSLKGPVQHVLSRCGVLLTYYNSKMSFFRVPQTKGGTGTRDGRGHPEIQSQVEVLRPVYLSSEGAADVKTGTASSVSVVQPDISDGHAAADDDHVAPDSNEKKNIV